VEGRTEGSLEWKAEQRDPSSGRQNRGILMYQT
jgi:hypothetical protein